MARARHRRTLAALALAGLATACGPGGGGGEAAGLRLEFEERQEPRAFQREGLARRDPSETEGSWAVVAGLPRPERALVENLDTGAETTVALFRGGSAPEVRLSAAAADALGIAERPARVRVTALRSEPTVQLPRNGF